MTFQFYKKHIQARGYIYTAAADGWIRVYTSNFQQVVVIKVDLEEEYDEVIADVDYNSTWGEEFDTNGFLWNISWLLAETEREHLGEYEVIG